MPAKRNDFTFAQNFARQASGGRSLPTIEDSRKLGYRRMRLDVVGEIMQNAVALYERFGFREIAPYNFNPFESVKYMEKVL